MRLELFKNEIPGFVWENAFDGANQLIDHFAFLKSSLKSG